MSDIAWVSASNKKGETTGPVNLDEFLYNRDPCVTWSCDNLPPYYHLEASGRIYAYHYPQYYAWGKRKACNK